MTLPTPPRYVVLPEEVIEQAYATDKPRRALLASFTRILSLAWEAKYEHTPPMPEDELIDFLKLSRRQYFEQKADMELVGWLRSSHPRPGFVQFSFSRSMSEKAEVQASAENRTVSAENRTDELKRIEEEESLEFKNIESSSILQEGEGVRKIAQVQKTALAAQTPSEKKMQLLVENLRLVFDPEEHGVLEMRDIFLGGIPKRVLGWIAKAYQDRKRLDSPIGMIVKHITLQDAPDRYFIKKFMKILPEDYLEAVGEIEYECASCDERFGTREMLHQHEQEKHPFPCSECDNVFLTQEELAAHYEDVHDALTKKKAVVLFQADKSVIVPINGNLNAEHAWQSVLGQLQMEMPRASFETWVRDTRAVRYDRNGSTLYIGVRNAYVRDWLESRLASTVSRLLIGILNASVTVVFVVSDGREGNA